MPLCLGEGLEPAPGPQQDDIVAGTLVQGRGREPSPHGQDRIAAAG